MISRAQENPETCKCGAPTHNGGKSSLIEMNKSVTSNLPTNASMSMEVKMQKDKLSFHGTNILELTRNGLLSILTKLIKDQPRVLTKTSDSISTDHSTSSQDCQ